LKRLEVYHEMPVCCAHTHDQQGNWIRLTRIESGECP